MNATAAQVLETYLESSLDWSGCGRCNGSGVEYVKEEHTKRLGRGDVRRVVRLTKRACPGCHGLGIVPGRWT